MSTLLGSSYTTQYIMEKCFPDVENVNDRVDCEVLHLENAKSFWSLIARISLNWKSNEDKANFPSSVFIKIPTISENALASDPDAEDFQQCLIDLTANEEHLYREMKNKRIKGFPYPRYYYGEEVHEIANREGCLVLEDLSGQVTSVDYIPGFSIQQVECLVDALAAWHIFAFENGSITKEFIKPNQIDESFQDLLFNESAKLESWRPEWFAGRIQGLKKYFSIDNAIKSINSYRELGIPPVIVHMDMNTTNVLWKKDTFKPEIAAIIDFQQVHTGNICEDLARVLQIGVSCDLRRANEDRLLKRYHQRLEEHFGHKNPITLIQVQSAYKRVFPFVSNFALFAVTCYHSMYSELEKDETVRKQKQDELLSRAKGVVDDVYSMVGL